MTVFPGAVDYPVQGGLPEAEGPPDKYPLPSVGYPDVPPASLGSLVAIVSNDSPEPHSDIKREHGWSTALQVAVPFFIAGAGTIGAGLVLGRVQFWPVFQEVSEVLILVPALLGLKGNLDMCLASRLSTQVNLGNMVTARDIWAHIFGNVALVQVQAIVAALLVAMFAVAVGAGMDGIFDWKHALLLAAASVITATTSCFVLDFVMIAVILVSHRLRVNPDNVATPLAASFGDVVSITVLANVASLLYSHHETLTWILPAIIILYIAMLPIWVLIVFRHKHTRRVLTSGWVPVLSALLISGMGGLVMDAVTGRFPGYVVFQPIINGIGGNLVSVQASRISTFLHQTSLLGVLPPDSRICRSPCSVLFWGAPQAKTSRILLAMAVPGHLLFAFLADYIFSGGVVTVNVLFMASYLTVSIIQVSILLYVANVLVHLVWRWKIDPDNSTIPYLTALGDLLGSSLLALAFWFLHSLGQPYRH